jgi:hypothetical protein
MGSFSPQLPQKAKPSGFEEPQAQHTSSSGAPQAPQNRMPEGFSKLHLAQSMGLNCPLQEVTFAHSLYSNHRNPLPTAEPTQPPSRLVAEKI